MKNKRNSLERL